MEDQLYCLYLWDYGVPPFISKSKAYYGTLFHIQSFITALEDDDKTRKDFSEMIAAFHEFKSGDLLVTHNVAYQNIPLLQPVEILGRRSLHLTNHSWTHINIWNCDHNMRCDSVDTQHLWISSAKGYYRIVKAHFNNLQHKGFKDNWYTLQDGFWGHPKVLDADGPMLTNRLFAAEKKFENRDEAMQNMLQFHDIRDVDFTEFCNDIFGDG